MQLANRESYERSLRDKIVEVFDGLRAEILRDPRAVDYREFRKRLAEVIERDNAVIYLLIVLLLIAWFESEVSRQTGDLELNAPDLMPAAQEYTKQRSAKVAKDVADSIQLAVAEVRAVAAETKQLDEIADRLKKTLDKQLSVDRAQSIAITEITYTISAADDSAARYIETRRPVQLPPIWFTQDDERVCPVCGPLHLKGPVAWAHMFPGGPPAHVRCRCWKDRKIVMLAPRGTGQKKPSRVN